MRSAARWASAQPCAWWLLLWQRHHNAAWTPRIRSELGWGAVRSTAGAAWGCCSAISCSASSPNLALDVWIANVRLDGQRELRTLANGMRRDRAAIQAALTTAYASGAVEGNVTRIKLLKRQMYGRANFDLLRRRILLSP
ncbi:transposase [Streptomyces sp. NPDC056949]|uniref:transposase n=1 Tax=Streptomyces sp. NPDC056949 TaxID=3345976 RepID=UPI003644888A